MKSIRSFQLLLLLAAFAMTGTACGKKDDAGDKNAANKPADKPAAKPADKPAAKPATMTAEQAKTEAAKVFAQRCTVCHGNTGLGDGAGAAALNPKPRNYTDKAWQKSVTDDQLKAIIIKGGMGVGKSPTMIASPDLGKPDKAPVLDALVQLIRAFGK